VSKIYQPSSKNGSMASVPSTSGGSLPADDLSRVLPRQLSTGTTRGTQNVGYGSAKIDGTNNRITVGGQDGGSVGMGSIPGSATNENGFFSLDAQGKLIMKIVGGTKYVYDPSNDYKNITQDGLLPDGTGGFVAAKPGVNVDDLFV
jgi:hypothetical protein